MKPKKESKLQNMLTVAHHDYEKGLNRRAFFKLNDHTLGGDLVQDTFTKTWIYLVRVGKIDTMKAFLYHVLNGLIIDEYRKRKNVSLEVLLEKGYEPGDDNTDSLINFLDGKEAMSLISQLPKKYMKVIKMKYKQNLSLKEISTLTAQTTNTVAVQIHRGLEMLRELYNNR